MNGIDYNFSIDKCCPIQVIVKPRHRMIMRYLLGSQQWNNVQARIFTLWIEISFPVKVLSYGIGSGAGGGAIAIHTLTYI
jgi:hypothetical protein